MGYFKNYLNIFSQFIENIYRYISCWPTAPMRRCYMLRAAAATHQHYWSKAARLVAVVVASSYLPRFALGQKYIYTYIRMYVCVWQGVVVGNKSRLFAAPFTIGVVHLPATVRSLVSASRLLVCLVCLLHRHPCRRLRLSASCIGQGSCSLHIRLAMPSSSFFRNALRISFARNTVTKGC